MSRRGRLVMALVSLALGASASAQAGAPAWLGPALVGPTAAPPAATSQAASDEATGPTRAEREAALVFRPRPAVRVIGRRVEPKDPRIPARSFFVRMPLDDFFVPEDGTWAVPRSGGRRKHKGLDLHTPEGARVYAVADGVVYRAWTSKPKHRDGGYGNYVILAHEARDPASRKRYWTYYTHMQNPPRVREGDRVPAGFCLGEVGRTPLGRFDNPHLHFEVRLDDGSELGQAIDPTGFGPFPAKFVGGEGAF